MVLQHASLEVQDIPENLFHEICDFVRHYFQAFPSGLESHREKANYPQSLFLRWAECMEYRRDACSIINSCTVYAHPLVFAPLLRTLIHELASTSPHAAFRGCFHLFNSNWGYDTYPFRAERGVLTWEKETLARQHPQTQKFWDAMQRANYTGIPDLLTAMYAPMTGRQLYNAFSVLDDLFFDPEQLVTPVDSCEFDSEGIPEQESMVEFTHTCFLTHCWKDYSDIWAFFRDLKEHFSQKNVPFEFPAEFLAALIR